LTAIVYYVPWIDGGQEVIEARFIHPRTALIEFREGKLSFMPPQYYLLSTLADILQGPTNTLPQREKVETLSSGLFGKMVVTPRRYYKKDDDDDKMGRVILTYEGDETRGGSKGRLHRALVKMTKDGVCCTFPSFFFPSSFVLNIGNLLIDLRFENRLPVKSS